MLSIHNRVNDPKLKIATRLHAHCLKFISSDRDLPELQIGTPCRGKTDVPTYRHFRKIRSDCDFLQFCT